MELNNMSIIELLELELSIKRCIIDKNKNTSFWDEIKQQYILMQKQSVIDEQIKKFIESSNKLKLIDDIGYSIAIHNFDTVGILNFSKDKLNDEYYGFRFSITNGLSKCRDDVTDKDLKQIKSILEIES